MRCTVYKSGRMTPRELFREIRDSGGRQVKNVGMHTHDKLELGALAYNRVWGGAPLPSVGYKSRAPGRRVRADGPLKLKISRFLDAQRKQEIVASLVT